MTTQPTEALWQEFGKFREENAQQHGELLARMERSHGELLARTERSHGELRTEMHREFAAMHRAMAVQLRWVIGMMAASNAGFIGAIIFLASRS